MNKVAIIGRLTRKPFVRTWNNGDGDMKAVANFTLAVDRRIRKENAEQSADYINCVLFGNSAAKADELFFRGVKLAVTGRIQTGSYTTKDGEKRYRTDVIVEDWEYAENKEANDTLRAKAALGDPEPAGREDEYMPIEGIDENIPFS